LVNVFDLNKLNYELNKVKKEQKTQPKNVFLKNKEQFIKNKMEEVKQQITQEGQRQRRKSGQIPSLTTNRTTPPTDILSDRDIQDIQRNLANIPGGGPSGAGDSVAPGIDDKIDEAAMAAAAHGSDIRENLGLSYYQDPSITQPPPNRPQIPQPPGVGEVVSRPQPLPNITPPADTTFANKVVDDVTNVFSRNAAYQQTTSSLDAAGYTKNNFSDYNGTVTLEDGTKVTGKSYSDLTNKLTNMALDNYKDAVKIEAKKIYNNINESNIYNYVTLDDQTKSLIKQYNLRGLLVDAVKEQSATGKQGRITKLLYNQIADYWAYDANRRGYIIQWKTSNGIKQPTAISVAQYFKEQSKAEAEQLSRQASKGDFLAIFKIFYHQTRDWQSVGEALYDTVMRTQSEDKIKKSIEGVLYRDKIAAYSGPIGSLERIYSMPVINLTMTAMAGYGLGAGLKILHAASPFLGTIVGAGVGSYGAIHTGQQIGNIYTAAQTSGVRSQSGKIAALAGNIAVGFAGAKAGAKAAEPYAKGLTQRYGKLGKKISITATETPTSQKMTAQRYLGFEDTSKGKIIGFKYGKPISYERYTPYSRTDIAAGKQFGIDIYKPSTYTAPTYSGPRTIVAKGKSFGLLYNDEPYIPTYLKGVKYTPTQLQAIKTSYALSKTGLTGVSPYVPSSRLYKAGEMLKLFIKEEEASIGPVKKKKIEPKKQPWEIEGTKEHEEFKKFMKEQEKILAEYNKPTTFNSTRTSKLKQIRIEEGKIKPTEYQEPIKTLKFGTPPKQPKLTIPNKEQFKPTNYIKPKFKQKFKTPYKKPTFQQRLGRGQYTLQQIKTPITITTQINQQKQIGKQQQLQLQIQEQSLSQQLLQKQIQIQQTKQKLQQLQLTIQQLQNQSLDQKTLQALIQIQKQLQLQLQKLKMMDLDIDFEEVIKIRKRLVLLSTKIEKIKKPRSGGYNTYVKKHATKPSKKYIKVSKKPLPYKQALGLGAKAVDETVARTFKVLPTKKKPEQDPYLDFAFSTRKHKIRKPIKKGKPQKQSPKWIEKTKYAIDSPGEFQGITVKGWQAKRKKKKSYIKPKFIKPKYRSG